jgi:hypothetical protein
MKPEGGRFDEDTYERARDARMKKAEAIANATDDPIQSMNKQLGWTDTGEKKGGFGAAFAAARAAGDKEFTFGGKKYHTRTKAEADKPAAPAASAPAKVADKPMPAAAKGSGRGGQGGPTAEELDAYAKSSAKRKVWEKTGLLPNRDRKMTGEEAAGQAADVAMAAIPLARGLGGAAKTASKSRALAERFDKITPIPNRAAPARRGALEGPRSGPALPSKGAGAPRLDGPSSSATPRVGAEAAPKGLPAPAKPTTKPPEAAKPSKPRKRAAARTKKFNDDEAGVEFAKGGMVKRGWGKARCK